MLYEPLPHKPYRPSPAVSFVGRQNSGKTTLLEKIIAELTRQGLAGRHPETPRTPRF